MGCAQVESLPEPAIEWYVPDGFTVQEEAPTAEQLAFDMKKGDEVAGQALVGRRLMYNWEGVGWCEGVIEARNTDKRFQMGGEPVTFWVYYELGSFCFGRLELTQPLTLGGSNSRIRRDHLCCVSLSPA